VSLAAGDFSLVGTELVFVDGSRMRNDFTHVVINAALDENLFQWKPPADFKVTEPFAK
jgi:outer membrane lipoprotein-sorting protein